MPQIRWTQKKLTETKAALADTGDVWTAADALTKRWKEDVTPKKIEQALSRYGMPSPVQIINKAATRRKSHAKAKPQNDQIDALVKAVHAGTGKSFEDLCNKLDLTPKACRALIKRAQKRGYDVAVQADVVQLKAEPDRKDPVKIAHLPAHDAEPLVFAAISDTHFGNELCASEELNSFLHYCYDVHGVRTVLHSGDMMDGELHRGHKYELRQMGFDNQADEALRCLPELPGLDYHFITGNHDYNSYWKAIGMDPGQALEEKAIARGRRDLHHHGKILAQLQFGEGDGAVKVELCHPKKGGGAYARSYPVQQWIERGYEGGDKPHVALLGHHHSYLVMEVRNVVAMQPGCWCWKTPYMQEKGLSPAVGGAIIWVWRDETGFRFRHEWCRWWPNGKNWLPV